LQKSAPTNLLFPKRVSSLLVTEDSELTSEYRRIVQRVGRWQRPDAPILRIETFSPAARLLAVALKLKAGG
jgi:hypothetical protein